MMNIPMAGQQIKGLLIAPETSRAYCLFKDTLSPDLIYRALGTKNFTYCTRYLGPIPFIIVCCVDVDEDAITTVHGPDRERVIIGSCMIFGQDEDGSFRSLSDFEIVSLRNNTTIWSKKNITYFGVNGMTKEPRPLELDVVNINGSVSSKDEVISLMNDRDR